VAKEVIELYRALIAEASVSRGSTPYMTKAQQVAKPDEADLLPGAITRLNALVPERIAQVEQLYQELLAQAEARHKKEGDEFKARLEELSAQFRDKSISLAESEARGDELRNRLRKQLQAAKKLCQFLDEMAN
jgi:Rad3-related DNA helicase